MEKLKKLMSERMLRIYADPKNYKQIAKELDFFGVHDYDGSKLSGEFKVTGLSSSEVQEIATQLHDQKLVRSMSTM